MIVDDEWQTREGLTQWVPWKELGISRVACMEDPVMALESMEKEMPDIVISDVRMPRMSGVDFLIRLRREGNMVPFLFISGYADKDYLMAAIRYQASDYVEKPVDMDELTEALRKIVAGVKESRSNREVISAVRLTSADTQYEDLEKFLRASEHTFSRAKNYWVGLIGTKEDYAEEVVRAWGWPQMQERLDEETLLFIACQLPGDEAPDFQKLFQMLRQWEKDVVLGVSRSCQLPRELSRRRAEATLALQRTWFGREEGLFFFVPPDGRASIAADQLVERMRPGLSAQTSQDLISHLSSLQKLWGSMDGLYPMEATSLLASIRERLMGYLPHGGGEAKADPALILSAQRADEAESLEEALLAMREWADLLFKNFANQHRYGTAMTKALEYVDQHYAENLSVELLAKECFVSSSHLSHLFRSSLNTSVKQYINDLRIERAKALLLDPKVRLYEVGSRVGISDASYFSKTFRKATGMTPSEYRAKYLQ